MKRNELRQNTGIALLFGVGSLSQSHYGSRSPALLSPESDVSDFEIISKLNGLEVRAYLHSNATRQNFKTSISKAAKSLGTGDFFLLFFSGFGGCIPNYTGKTIEFNKTWCLYDSQMLEIEVKMALSAFQIGVNILVVSDCSPKRYNDFTSELKTVPKALPQEISDSVYLSNKDFYDAATLSTISQYSILANAVWLQACQPNQMSRENAFNGLLTKAVKRLWKGGIFSGSFHQFLEEVVLLMPAYQSPRIEVLGGNPSELFSKRPFSI